MLAILKHELKSNIKSLLIWSLCIGGFGMCFIILYTSMQDSIAEMADSFASMGAFSDAFGMSELSIGTLTGYFASEIGLMHGLGGGLFTATLATILLSKEEDGHTSEFLYSLPISRGNVMVMKFISLISSIVFFQMICACLYGIGFCIIGEGVPLKRFLLFLVMEFFMNVEIGAICYAISAFCRRNKLGVGLGVVLLLYAFDFMARVIPDIKKMNLFSPYSYSNGSEIFLTGEVKVDAILVGIFIIIVSIFISYMEYTKRDLES